MREDASATYSISQESTRKQPEIASALGLQCSLLHELQRVTGTLEDRLGCVLRSEPPKDVTPGLEPSSTQVGSTLEEHNELVRQIHRRIESVINRCELPEPPRPLRA